MFLDQLKEQFSVTVSPATYFLGLEIKRQDDGSIVVGQENYIKKMLEKFKLSDCNSVGTPVDGVSIQSDCDVDLDSCVPYREAVGSLMYLAVNTRPDIAYTVSLVSQSLDKPTQRHWGMVKRIFRYLKGTVKYGLTYKCGDVSGLEAYCDADFAGDLTTRKSRTGVVCLYNGTAVSWFSQRQKSVSLSTTEAELIAASEATKEVIWLKRLFGEISGMKTVPMLHVDNMSAIKLVKNPAFHKRSKHIEVRHFFIREKFEQGCLDIKHVASESNLADVFTKPTSKPKLYNMYMRMNSSV